MIALMLNRSQQLCSLLLTSLILTLSLHTSAARASLLDELVGSDEPQFLPVDQAFPLSTETDGNDLNVRFTSADGY